ncbi:universal stress protein [Schlesneria sp. DSM 10557]|uniref:universal stress protein n=1 Tax=Schlesneria sp. DSM 10557 TaxID=3044399 RepID=UPI00359FDDE7
MPHLQNILVGVDLHHGDRIASSNIGAESKAAVDEAIQLALVSGGAITFCSVLELTAQSQSLIEKDHENILKTVEDYASITLSELVESANAQGIAAESRIRFGAAWEELSKESAEGKYDVVLVGTRSRTRAATLLFGSTVQKLMRFAPCPVWVAKPSEVREIREVAVATDLSDACLPAIKVAAAISRQINAKLYVLHVLETGDLRYLAIAGVAEEELRDTEAQLRINAVQKLKEQLSQVNLSGIQNGVHSEVLMGDPDTTIPQFVLERQVDLLVIGTHGRGLVSGLLLGNTAARILPSLRASLVAVKPAGYVSPYAKQVR